MSTKNMEPATSKKLIIDSASVFEEWSRSLQKFNSAKELKTVVFNLSEFSFQENVTISTKIDQYINACGCQSGSFLMLLTFITTLGHFFISGGRFSELTIFHVLSCMGITLLGGMAGKAIGLLNAHLNLIRLVHRIQKRLNSSRETDNGLLTNY